MKVVKQTEVVMTSVKLALAAFDLKVVGNEEFTADHVIVDGEKLSYIGYITTRVLPTLGSKINNAINLALVLEKSYTFLNTISDNYKIVKSLLIYKETDEVVTSLLPLFKHWCHLGDELSPIIGYAIENGPFRTFESVITEYTWDYTPIESLFPLKLVRITKDEDGKHYLDMMGGNSRYEYLVSLFHVVNIRETSYKKELSTKLGIIGTELSYSDVSEKANNKHVVKNKDLNELKLLAITIMEHDSVPLTQRQKRFVGSVAEISKFTKCVELENYCRMLLSTKGGKK